MRKDDDQCHERFFTDECMEILIIRNAQIITEPNSLLNLCSPSVLEYLRASANLKIHIYDFNRGDNPDNLLETCQIYRPIDPISLAKISTVTKGENEQHFPSTRAHVERIKHFSKQMFLEYMC